MGNGHCLALLERLAQGDASVETLTNTTDLTIGNASQHRQHLRRAGLVTAQHSGKQMIYRLTDERIINLLGLLRQVTEANLAEMERLVSRLFAVDDAAGVLEAVSLDELLAGFASGEVALLDVRPEEEYEAGKLPRDKEIVAYCRGPYCALSHEAVLRFHPLEILISMGIQLAVVTPDMHRVHRSIVGQQIGFHRPGDHERLIVGRTHQIGPAHGGYPVLGALPDRGVIPFADTCVSITAPEGCPDKGLRFCWSHGSAVTL